MKSLKTSFLFSALGALLLFSAGCKKQEISIPDSGARFVASGNSGVLQVLNNESSFTLPVGATTVSPNSRTVDVEVTSPSGAVLGTHYTLSLTGKTLTIDGGAAISNIVVKGVVNQYTSGRKDTLIFRITDAGDVKATPFDSLFTLVLRGPCFEGDVDLNAMLGDYRATETFGSGAPYGPYPTSISSVTETSPTTGTIVVENIWNNGWSALTFNLNWTDPANRTATVVTNTAIGGSNSGDLNSTYDGITMQARPFAGQPGTFSACNETFTLKMQLGVTGVGFFGSLYTVNMTR